MFNGQKYVLRYCAYWIQNLSVALSYVYWIHNLSLELSADWTLKYIYEYCCSFLLVEGSSSGTHVSMCLTIYCRKVGTNLWTWLQIWAAYAQQTKTYLNYLCVLDSQLVFGPVCRMDRKKSTSTTIVVCFQVRGFCSGAYTLGQPLQKSPHLIYERSSRSRLHMFSGHETCFGISVRTEFHRCSESEKPL